MTHAEWVAGFWRRVVRLGGRQCWAWRGTVSSGGYGQLKRADGKTNVYAHRAAMEIHTGRPVPRNRVVMHTCDNPRCTNPSHLIVSTQKNNVQDMHRKGRANPASVKGERHGKAKLTDLQVLEIRAAWDMRHTDPKITQTNLARRYGVGQSQISRIVSGKRRT